MRDKNLNALTLWSNFKCGFAWGGVEYARGTLELSEGNSRGLPPKRKQAASDCQSSHRVSIRSLRPVAYRQAQKFDLKL